METGKGDLSAQPNAEFLQWSHSLSAMETLGNGYQGPTYYPPSMEPQPFGHGNLFGQGDPGVQVGPSMEPQPFGHGNTRGMPVGSVPWSTLQWSHSLSAMETRQSRIWWWVGLLPSMEPQPFGHGNAGGYRRNIRVYAILQWSHSLSAMETAVLCGTNPEPRPFNGATAFRPWKPSVALPG